MRALDALPRFAAVATVIVWGITLPLLATFGKRLTDPPTLSFVIDIGIASLLILFAQNPNQARSSLMLWISAGIWAAASYLNQQVVGFSYLLVAILSLGSAAIQEREHGHFSLAGPVGFIAAAAVTIIGSELLAR